MSRRLVIALLAAGLIGTPSAAAVGAPLAGGLVTGAHPSSIRAASSASPGATPTSSTTPSSPTPSATSKPAPKPAPKKPAPKPAPTKPAPKPTSRPAVLRPGARGAAVTMLQTRLAKLGYWVGTPNGRYDHETAQAVMALQKVAGLGRDGITGPATWRALDRGVQAKPRSTKGRVLEVDLKRQVMIFSVDGTMKYVLNTSTGAAATPTPRGSYRIFRQQDGWRTAPLGRLYRPKYFYRGYAVHGVADGSIPGYPASHGCTRVSMKAMDMMWGKGGLRYKDRVWVY